MKRLTAILDGITDYLAVFAQVLIFLAMVVVTANVCSRYFFNFPWFWVTESAQWALVFMTLLGTAWVLKKEGHVSVDLITNMLEPKSRGVLNVITSILSAIVCLVITWYGARVTWEYFQTDYIFSGTMEVPAYLLQFVIPVGGFLLFTEFVRRAYRYASQLGKS